MYAIKNTPFLLVNKVVWFIAVKCVDCPEQYTRVRLEGPWKREKKGTETGMSGDR